MSEHTLEQLLARMRDKPITLGWGAIAAFGRDRLNDFLRQQFVAGNGDFRLAQPFSAQVALDPTGVATATLTDLVFGPPQVSFESSALPGSHVTLNLAVVAGSFSVIGTATGMPPRLAHSFDFSEQGGFRFHMKLDLSTIVAEVDRSGRFALDLANGEKWSCNLVEEWPAQELLGAAVANFFKGLPANNRTFELGGLDFNGYHPLSAVSFHLCAQRLPGAEDGDGALMVFCRLKGLNQKGGLPADEDDLPYLIPTDRANGKPLYSAALVLNHELIEWVDEDQLELLRHMLFPGQQVFVEAADGRHEPHDLLILGNVPETPQSVAIEPLYSSVKAGGQRQFRLLRGDGSEISGALWSTRSLDSPLAVGSVSSSGLYTAPAATLLSRDAVPALVVAEYMQDNQLQRVTAMVTGRSGLMSVLPRISVVGHLDDPVDIHASTLSGGDVQWELLEPQLGTLEVKADGHAVYTRPASVEPLITLQKIRCTDRVTGERIESAMVVLRAGPAGVVEPAFVPSIRRGSVVPFHSTNIPDAMAHWRVIGEGTVDEHGLFTPPEHVTSLVSLVLCDLKPDPSGPAVITGYAVVQLSEAREQLHWRTLAKFSVTAPGDLRQCYINGMQQIPLVIEVTTDPVKVNDIDIYIPLSDSELASMRLVALGSSEIPFLPSAQDGIEHDSPEPYATHSRKNRFHLYSPTVAGLNAHQPLPQTRAPGQRFREIFLHVRAEGSRTFHARFQDDLGGIHDSNEEVTEGHEIEITGEQIPAVDPIVGPNRDFDIVRTRVFNGPGTDGPNGDDPFNFRLTSVDYWDVIYKRNSLYTVPFSTLEVESNASTLQWESEQMDETFFSFTGYGFYPYPGPGNDKPPVRLEFDPYFRALDRNAAGTPIRQDFEDSHRPSPGELMVSLHRSMDMTYWYDEMAEGDENRMYRQMLDGPVVFVMRDVEGNRHRLQVGFPSPSLIDSRNTLVLNIQ
ncbi:hypothetical protein V0R50_09120 [Pseudomonas sp. 148P]|uniref:Imidazoleglycerol-phosphate synthase n=1 Tax=Pseudomonas ulcerans TaxID=3115852 RepID=A0ABU7HPD4_9PSED|nr:MULTISPECIES: hypothetical protein [unclassified Pseudomonas]MEE1920601.1 hypothetical protein [Pseudomonas sp. 147P]MEE1933383.1 hypothetical protein [Pseudomonas sp. 148P]